MLLVKARKAGGSIIITIPKDIAMLNNINIGDFLEVRQKDDMIIIKKEMTR